MGARSTLVPLISSAVVHVSDASSKREQSFPRMEVNAFVREVDFDASVHEVCLVSPVAKIAGATVDLVDDDAGSLLDLSSPTTLANTGRPRLAALMRSSNQLAMVIPRFKANSMMALFCS
jgi:hypothetical protein